MDFRKKFVAKPGVKFKLDDIDPADEGEHESNQSAAAEIARHTASLARLQYKLYAENKRSLLIVLQGLKAGARQPLCLAVPPMLFGTDADGIE
jgi:hypothetical protein